MKRGTAMSAWRSLDAFGWTGLAAMAFATLHFVALVLPLQREQATLQAQAQSLEQRLRKGESLTAIPELSAGEQLATFYAFFPSADSSVEWLGRIHAAANEHGLAMPAGEYRLERAGDQRLLRYVVTLPLTGTYAELRGFVASVLADVPAAAVDDIRLRRESAASPQLEARVRISLFLVQR